MTTLDATALRETYPAPSERAVRKMLPALDHHMRRFISLSPFLCMGTSSDAVFPFTLNETSMSFSPGKALGAFILELRARHGARA